MSNLIPASELKPLGWFCVRNPNDDRIGLKIDNEWYVCRAGVGESRELKTWRWDATVMIQPLPDCTSFDYVLPREPTALELAKALRDRLVALNYLRSAAEIQDIIAAIEREAAQ